MQTLHKDEVVGLMHPKCELARWYIKRLNRSQRHVKPADIIAGSIDKRAKDRSILILAAKAT